MEKYAIYYTFRDKRTREWDSNFTPIDAKSESDAQNYTTRYISNLTKKDKYIEFGTVYIVKVIHEEKFSHYRTRRTH